MGIFTDDDVWTGGFYELALEYESCAGLGLIGGLQQLWRAPDLDGCYLDRNRDPEDQPRVEFEPSLLSHGHLQGIGTLPNGKEVACGTCCVLEADGSDWLILYCTMSALARSYPVGGFPFDRDSHESWRVPLEVWFAKLGRAVFRQAPFRLGLVGFEASAEMNTLDLAPSGVPDQRSFGLLVPSQNGLTWHPRTKIVG